MQENIGLALGRPIHWEKQNSNPTNDFGYTALPGGIRLVDKSANLLGPFQNLGVQSVFWSKTEIDNSFAWGRELSVADSKFKRYSAAKQCGFSVRCIKDVPAKPTPKFVSKAPTYKYPNNTVGQIKNGYFFPGFYEPTNDNYICDRYDICGMFPYGNGYLAGSFFRFADSNRIVTGKQIGRAHV